MTLFAPIPKWCYRDGGKGFISNCWKVTVTTREQGALGVFEPTVYYVRAEEKDIQVFVLDDVERDGLEPGVILSKVRLT